MINWFWVETTMVAISVVISSSLLITALGTGWKKRLNLAFALFIGMGVCWAAVSALLRYSLIPDNVISNYPLQNSLLWFQFSIFFIMFMGIFSLRFSGIYLNKYSRKIEVSTILGITAGLLYSAFILFPGRGLLLPEISSIGLLALEVTPLGAIGVLITLPFFIWSLFLFWPERKKEPYITLGFIVLIGGMLVGGMSLPFPFNSTGSLLAMTLFGYAVINKQMFNPLKEMNMKLRESEEKFSKIFHLTPSFMLLVDLETGKRMDVNNAYEKATGYTKSELLGKNAIDTSILADKNVAIQGLSALARGEKATGTMTTDLQKKDGGTIKILYSADAIKLHGKSVAIISGQDITEMMEAEEKIKKSLEEKEVLLREVHHRVKNNMQVISSILSMQAVRTKEEDSRTVLEESQSRIRSMAMVHDMLFSSESLSQIDLGAYIENIVESISIGFGEMAENIGVNINVNDIHLDAKSATSMGLVVNELVTNSYKHAFPDGKGLITIEAKKIGGDNIELIIGDDGKGVTCDMELDEAKTLGLKLVKSMIKSLPEGNINCENENGSTFTIQFKPHKKIGPTMEVEGL